MAKFFREEAAGRLTGFALVKHSRGERLADFAQSMFFAAAESIVSATAEWSEANDSAVIAGSVGSGVSGGIELTEQADAAAISSTVRVSGASSIVEQSDTASVSGSIKVNIAAGWAEQSDTSGFSIQVLAQAGLALLDENDSFYAYANVSINAIGGIEWQEQPDLVSITGLLPQLARSPSGAGYIPGVNNIRPSSISGERPANSGINASAGRPAATQRGTR